MFDKNNNRISGKKLDDTDNPRLQAERNENERLKKIQKDTSADILDDILIALGHKTKGKEENREANVYHVKYFNYDVSNDELASLDLYRRISEIKNMCEAEAIIRAIHSFRNAKKLPNYSKDLSYETKRNSKDENFDEVLHEIDNRVSYETKAISQIKDFLFDELVHECGTGRKRANLLLKILTA